MIISFWMLLLLSLLLFLFRQFDPVPSFRSIQPTCCYYILSLRIIKISFFRFSFTFTWYCYLCWLNIPYQYSCLQSCSSEKIRLRQIFIFSKSLRLRLCLIDPSLAKLLNLKITTDKDRYSHDVRTWWLTAFESDLIVNYFNEVLSRSGRFFFARDEVCCWIHSTVVDLCKNKGQLKLVIICIF